MKISVISPCRNEEAYIDAFLESVLEQKSEDFELEVIIADGLSDDGTMAKLASWAMDDKRIKIISNPGKIVSTGLNRAIAIASGEIIVRMDIHTSYASDYIRQCASTLIATGAQCVGGPWRAKGETTKQQGIVNAFQSRFGSGGSAARRLDYSGPVDTVYLGTWWKTDLQRFGGFDEDLVRNQDDELCLRITRGGGKIWQSTDIHSIYMPRNSLTNLWKQFHQYGYWKALVMKKHGIPASLRHLAPVTFIITLAVLLALSPFWPEAGIVFLLLLSVYIISALCFACGASGWTRSLNTVLYTGAAYFAMHFSYGIGFARGISDFVLFSRGGSKSMTSLSR